MKISEVLGKLRIAMSLLPGRHGGWLVGAVLGSVLLALLDMLGGGGDAAAARSADRWRLGLRGRSALGHPRHR